MKLFGEPISVDQLEVGKYYEFMFAHKILLHTHTKFCYGMFVGQNNNNPTFRVLLPDETYQTKTISNITRIRPINITFMNKPYYFNIDGIEPFVAVMKFINNEGDTLLYTNNDLTILNSPNDPNWSRTITTIYHVNVSQIIDILPGGINDVVNYAVNSSLPSDDAYQVEMELLDNELESYYGGTKQPINIIHKRWSTKYKRSINCRKPKGFSQKQYCKYGRRKTQSRTNLK